MNDLTGIQCPVCKEKFTETDDIVFCPDCGTPHHRACWEKVGHCIHAEKHSTGYEWQMPNTAPAQKPQQETDTGAAAQPNTSEDFDYSQLYQNSYTPPQGSAQAEEQHGLDSDAVVENIPVSDWSNFLGKSNYLYIMLFKQMELLHRRVSISMSAMLFGPLYFAYRKAWKPAILLALAKLVVDAPSMLYVLHVSGSALTAHMSGDLLYRLMSAAYVLNIALLALQGAYGFYWYKKHCIRRIQKIRAAYPDANQRQYVLRAQGGTSWSAVFLMAGIFLALAAVMSMFVGPNMAALYSLLG